MYLPPLLLISSVIIDNKIQFCLARFITSVLHCYLQKTKSHIFTLLLFLSYMLLSFSTLNSFTNQMTFFFFFSTSLILFFDGLANIFSCTLSLPCNSLGQKEITVMANQASFCNGRTRFNSSYPSHDTKSTLNKKLPRVVLVIIAIFF